MATPLAAPTRVSLPSQYFDVGIRRQQHAVTMAAGMATAGLSRGVAIIQHLPATELRTKLIHDVGIQKLRFQPSCSIVRRIVAPMPHPPGSGRHQAYQAPVPNFTVMPPG